MSTATWEMPTSLAPVEPRQYVGYDCRPGDIIVIPDYQDKGLDHAFYVQMTCSTKTGLIGPNGECVTFPYDELVKIKAYYIWFRPVDAPPALKQ